jgi:hypothetical protein
MTYNFDPDTWLNTNRAALEARRDRGELSDAEFETELEDLDRRYEEMVARLDGTYVIPSGGSGQD